MAGRRSLFSAATWVCARGRPPCPLERPAIRVPPRPPHECEVRRTVNIHRSRGEDVEVGLLQAIQKGPRGHRRQQERAEAAWERGVQLASAVEVGLGGGGDLEDDVLEGGRCNTLCHRAHVHACPKAEVGGKQDAIRKRAVRQAGEERAQPDRLAEVRERVVAIGRGGRARIRRMPRVRPCDQVQQGRVLRRTRRRVRVSEVSALASIAARATVAAAGVGCDSPRPRNAVRARPGFWQRKAAAPRRGPSLARSSAGGTCTSDPTRRPSCCAGR